MANSGNTPLTNKLLEVADEARKKAFDARTSIDHRYHYEIVEAIYFSAAVLADKLDELNDPLVPEGLEPEDA